MSIIKPCRIKGVTMGKNLAQEKTSILKKIDFKVEINKKAFDLPLDDLTKKLSEKDINVKKAYESSNGKYYVSCNKSFALQDFINNLSKDELIAYAEKSIIINPVQSDFRNEVEVLLGIGKLTQKDKMKIAMFDQLKASGKFTDKEITDMVAKV